MAVEELVGTQSRAWGEYRAEEWSDAVVAAMKLGRSMTSSSCPAPRSPSSRRASPRRAVGPPAPRLVTVTHESVALNAALGSAMVTGQPAASAVHVDVGTLNYGGAIHTAWRGDYPVLITAGHRPARLPRLDARRPRQRRAVGAGAARPGRDRAPVHEGRPSPGAPGQPRPDGQPPAAGRDERAEGPVYMSMPRESAMLPLPGTTRFPTRDELGLARPAVARPGGCSHAWREWLVKAENPCISAGKSGRNPESVEALVRLAELLAHARAWTARGDRLNFPHTHPLYGTGPAAEGRGRHARAGVARARGCRRHDSPRRGREDRLGRRRPGAVALQDHGVPRRPVAAGRRRAARHARSTRPRPPC